MCGISGFVDPARASSGAVLEQIAERMADALHHRGPDDAGTWADPAHGIAFGHRRLSIIDLSPAGHQPMVSSCGRYVICYNGELYNFQALREELAGLGRSFRGHSDTEVLLECVAEWGFEAALDRLNGMFALALWDRHEGRLLLARDRMGEKPLYYGWAGGVFLFGSELKALRAHPGFRGEVDRDVLALYFRHNYVPTPYCIYRGLRKLPPGTWLELRARDASAPSAPMPEPRPYWSVEAAALAGMADPLRADEPELLDALDALLRDSVRLRMVADVPLGAFLSGGVDSSTVVALMQAQSARPVNTFTIGFDEAAFDEARFAKPVAEHLGTHHTELILTPHEAMDVVPHLPTRFDEPFADVSQIPTYLVSRLARGQVTVALSGDGGDELFGGYSRYALAARLWSLLSAVPRPLRQGLAALIGAVPRGAWDALVPPVVRRRIPGDLLRQPGHRAHRLAGWLGARDGRDLYGRLLQHVADAMPLVPGAGALATPLTEPARSTESAPLRQQMMLLDMLTYLPDDILVKVDRASMAVSLESRLPLLDHRLVELAWRIPPHHNFRAGGGKALLRRLLARYVPEHLTERPKMGFGVPIGAWLAGPLRPWAEDLLGEPALAQSGLLDPRPVRRMWADHLAGRGDWHYALWNVLMFQAWHRQHHPTG